MPPVISDPSDKFNATLPPSRAEVFPKIFVLPVKVIEALLSAKKIFLTSA